jgi:hypothetical protein
VRMSTHITGMHTCTCPSSNLKEKTNACRGSGSYNQHYESGTPWAEPLVHRAQPASHHVSPFFVATQHNVIRVISGFHNREKKGPRHVTTLTRSTATTWPNAGEAFAVPRVGPGTLDCWRAWSACTLPRLGMQPSLGRIHRDASIRAWSALIEWRMANGAMIY